MKRCNICGREYPDNLSFCTSCGSKLSEAETSHASTSTTQNGQNDNGGEKKTTTLKSKTGKIVKRTIIAVVAIVAILFLWGTHLINSTTYMTFNSKGELYAKCGGSSDVNIDYDGYVWEVNYKPSWVSLMNTMTVSPYTANLTLQAKTVKIT